VIINGGDISSLPVPQSREEALLLAIIEKISGAGKELPIRILTGSDYDHITGEPTVNDPEENVFYLVPAGSGDDMYEEWTYIDGKWEHFGAGGSIKIPQSDWNQADSTAVDYVKNKPTIPDGLPEVAQADNGKFLRVVNGEWVAQAVVNASGVGF